MIFYFKNMNDQNKFSIYRNVVCLVIKIESAVKNFVISLQKGKCFIFTNRQFAQHLQPSKSIRINDLKIFHP
ncbi:hypothetical protein BTHERMOSOX_1657 [Bathymodiolus thermophilus thioautotrophic gill symbiont]|jgi:hypothetical protein|uniref:Uncharacterized protein n=1 Tax=Bathymodiolus thermophilus thioautotrophic gill symbiont TaxID=2360 RepID=A0A1J5U7M0_9GAMM|nr:hypothetical protein MS2017_1760 [Bathymodiolus thermophilus thioautotrophic gill symbiont]OIR24369.1 hypothetical protein BGC33_10225 [Bathymodiolus thermophilus thioautotrophic gill symbiont]CAB5495339.1 hypothetical protein THERMOT_295 [Bathymodiolus thermophilus thioautotrophic gill symbiont]CAB5504016.1 hypothetical protein THERMOS_1881 [Bathymodiolus thermophilus thioautotrophic gill symbiont]SGZ81442.1 hypothetical protein BTHERMOSOX_1657 [Bathymodiolus thermophilus thioautotrophic gi